MVMRKFSRCPRCGGNMFLERDLGSLYEECLQCSCRREVVKLPGVAANHVEGEKAPALEEDKVLSPLG